MSDRTIDAIADAMWRALDTEQAMPHSGVDARFVVAEFLAALKAARIAVVELPDPGALSDHHQDNDLVWYHGQDGEFVTRPDERGTPNPVWDSDGNCWSIAHLRELAAAALAAADAGDGA